MTVYFIDNVLVPKVVKDFTALKVQHFTSLNAVQEVH